MGEGIAQDEQILFSLTTTRKGYILEYVCTLFLILLPLFASIKGYAIPVNIVYLLIGLGTLILIYTEIARIYTRYTVTNKKLVIVRGLLRQDKKNVYFHPLAFVPDINVEQNMLQRLFNVGTISVKSSDVSSFEIRDIDSPHEIAQEIERLIDEERRSGAQKK